MPINASHPILSAKQMQLAELLTINDEGIPAADLMHEAGKAVASAANKHKLGGGRFVIVVGIGNNAGDGFIAARLLRQKRIAVTVVPLFPLELMYSDTAEQAELARQAGAKIRPATSSDDLEILESWLKRAVIVVDAIFGTGLSRPLSGWLAQAVDCINRCGRPILAIDIASGLDSDTGQTLGTAIKATVTLPIAAYKWGHWLQQGTTNSGTILEPASIGISATTIQQAVRDFPGSCSQSQLIDYQLIRAAFPKRPAQSFKQSFGHLWIFGGSVGYTGAPQLAAMGAQAVGTGLVSIACPADAYAAIAASALEVMVHPQEQAPWMKASAIVAGPGWSRYYSDKLHKLLLSNSPVVLDADALNILATDHEIKNIIKRRGATTVLTPHPGEAGRLLGLSAACIQEDRLGSALALVDRYQCWVVLKGAQTMIVSPDKSLWLNPFGSVKLAVAGSGDVLSGMIGGLLASGQDAEIVIPAAVALHGLAGEKPGWHRASQLEEIIATMIEKF